MSSLRGCRVEIQGMSARARGVNEGFKMYRARLRAEKVREKQAMRGRLLWNSLKAGPYRRALHGPLR